MSAVAQAIPLVPAALRFMGESDSAFWQIADELAAQVSPWVTQGVSVLDFGCGYGRLAYGLARRGFVGGYLGVDVLARHVSWLASNFAPRAGGNYRFVRLDLHSGRYNPQGKRPGEIDFGIDNGSLDCVVALAVFTHMPEGDVVDYLNRLSAFLKPGGTLVATFFRLPPGYELGQEPANCSYPLAVRQSANAFIHNLNEPLHVVAYREEFLLQAFQAAGLHVVRDTPGGWFGHTAGAAQSQDWFVLRKHAPQPPAAGAVAPARVSPEYEGGIKRLHIGCGPHHIWADWWNVDIRPFAGVDECRDVTIPWAWQDLELVFAEHFLQALTLDGALQFLCHAGNALRRGGVMRLSIPNLRWVLLTHLRPHEKDPQRAVQGTLAINRAFYGWQHRFLWTDALLGEVLAAMGFAGIRFCEYGQSTVPALQGRESHGNLTVCEGQASVVIVECERGDRAVSIPDALVQRLEKDFSRYVRDGH
jgi:SAM-dependent methyltransferase